MVNKIFRSNFFTSMLILLVSFCLIFGVLFSYFEAQMFTELESEAGYISYAIKNEGTDFIDNFNEKGKRKPLSRRGNHALIAAFQLYRALFQLWCNICFFFSQVQNIVNSK